jgi:hypothetical protein
LYLLKIYKIRVFCRADSGLFASFCARQGPVVAMAISGDRLAQRRIASKTQ